MAPRFHSLFSQQSGGSSGEPRGGDTTQRPSIRSKPLTTQDLSSLGPGVHEDINLGMRLAPCRHCGDICILDW